MGIQEIYGTKGNRLLGKRIGIGVTGSIAAIESPHLVREIIRFSGDPEVILSSEAQRFVTVDSLTWSMDKEPLTNISGFSEHIKFTSSDNEKLDLYIICPATANTIAKIVSGIADTPVTLVALAAIGANIPIIIVPNAHSVLLDNVIIEKHLSKLKQMGVTIIELPEEENKYKYPPLSVIMKCIFGKLENSTSKKQINVLITGGATREYIDDVRFLSNPSTGKSALELTKAFTSKGSSVDLVLGEGHTINPNGFNHQIVTSTEDMYHVLHKKLANSDIKYDCLVSVAAISDYTPSKIKGKIPSKKESLSINFKPTKKIISILRNEFPDLPIVGYKAEVGIGKNDLINRGKEILEKNNLQMVVANWVGESDKGFMADSNEVFLIQPNNKIDHLIGTKSELAQNIVETILSILEVK